MRFNPAAFNTHLSGPLGQAFFWRRRSQCPCIKPGSGQAALDCPVCDGHGHIWAAPVAAKAGQSTQSPSKAIAMFGAWESGDAVISIGSDSPMYKAGQYDRIRSVDSTSEFSSAIDPNRNPKLLGSIKEITATFWLNDAGDTIVPGGIPTVNPDGSMTFTTGAPPAGRQFTVEGVRYDEWMVYFPQTQDRNAGVSGLPRKLPVRRLDVVLRQNAG